MKKKEIDEIENQIVKIITSSNEADKEIEKEGLADHKFIKRIADDCRKLDQLLLEQVTLSKYEVSKIFEEYLKHEKIDQSCFFNFLKSIIFNPTDTKITNKTIIIINTLIPV